jgi:hypothetical protein
MRLALIIIAALLLLGCTGERGSPANITNTTNATISSYARFMASSFSFDYPSNMDVQNLSNARGGYFIGSHELAYNTGEVLALIYINTSATYGVNTDSGFQANPDLAASSFLEKDKTNDPAGYLETATEIGSISTFARGRDVFISEAPFTMKLTTGTYTGYALSMYVPARSTEVQTRILALDANLAKQMRDEFILSFRIE